MFFNAPILGLLLASPAFAAVLPLVARDVLEARQSGGGPFDGEATTFTGSPKSSCGAPLAADAIAVALNGDWQTGTSPNLAACGKQVTITNSGNGLQGSIIAGSSKGKTITATVLDTCPECDRTHIDLTTGAWNALTDSSPGGVVSITWSFVGGAPSSSGGGSSSTTPTSDSSPAAGSGTSNSGTGGTGQTVSKVAKGKVGTSPIFNLATLPQSGDLAALQQTGTGSGDNTTDPGTGSTSSGSQKDATGTGSTSGTPASGSGTPASGSGTPASGAGTPASGSGTPASGSGTPSSGGTTTGGGTDSGASGGVAGRFFQCGGQSWSGPTNCESGTTCQVQNQFYSQCL